MPGIGTIINVTAIICGGLLGLNFGHLLYQADKAMRKSKEEFLQESRERPPDPLIFFLYYIYDCIEKAGINRLFLWLLKLAFL